MGVLRFVSSSRFLGFARDEITKPLDQHLVKTGRFGYTTRWQSLEEGMVKVDRVGRPDFGLRSDCWCSWGTRYVDELVFWPVRHKRIEENRAIDSVLSSLNRQWQEIVLPHYQILLKTALDRDERSQADFLSRNGWLR